jgi:hypothetical protein
MMAAPGTAALQAAEAAAEIARLDIRRENLTTNEIPLSSSSNLLVFLRGTKT